MTAGNSKNSPRTKPAKPTPDFPLYPHASGRWAKKIRGQTHYFGKWDDPQAALTKYLAERETLERGDIVEPEAAEGLTVRALCAKFLAKKKELRDSGEISPFTFVDYADTVKLFIKVFRPGRLVDSLTPGDFDKLRAIISRSWGPIRTGNVI